MEAVDAYDPFALYRRYEERRDAGVPPHLVFASLQPFRPPRNLIAAGQVVDQLERRAGSLGDRQVAAAFLLTYGWPCETRSLTPKFKNGTTEFSGAFPDQIWRRKLNRKYPLQPPPLTKASETWTAMRLDKFWEEQQIFSLVAQTLAIIRHGGDDQDRELKELFTSAVCFPVGVYRGYNRVHASWPIIALLTKYFGVGPVPSSLSEKDYWRELQKQLFDTVTSSVSTLRERAIEFIREVMVDRLKGAVPFLDYEGDCFLCTWNCQELLDAFYVMLFLDVEFDRRILRCEGCGILFAEAKTNVTHCSDRCGNRVRVRRTIQGKPTRQTKRH